MKLRTFVAASLVLVVGACHPSAQVSGPRIPDLRADDLRKDASLYPKYHQFCLTLNNSDISRLESHRCVSLDAQERVVADEKLFGSGH